MAIVVNAQLVHAVRAFFREDECVVVDQRAKPAMHIPFYGVRPPQTQIYI